MLQVDNHLQPVLLEALHRLARHHRFSSCRRFEPLGHVEQTRLHHHHRFRHAPPCRTMNLRPANLEPSCPDHGCDRTAPASCPRVHPIQGPVRSSTNWLAPANPISAYLTPNAPIRCSRPTAFGTEISRLGCCIPSRRLVSNNSTLLLPAAFPHLSLFPRVKVSFKLHRSAPQRRTSIIPVRNCIARNRVPHPFRALCGMGGSAA